MTASFVLIPGAGGMAWYWHRVAEALAHAGREAIAVDLPADDPAAGLPEYAALVVRAIGERMNVILVAQSLGAFTAPLVCEPAPVRMLVFVNAMIPRPGETAGAWWDNTGAVEARLAAARAGGYSIEVDLQTYFLHDVPEAVLRAGPGRRDESEIAFGQPCAFRAWPALPMRVIAGADDRFFPVEFQKRIARERLGLEADVLPGGHLISLSNPKAVVERLVRYERELMSGSG
jgi:pimeloyl-ACP methyl ester carboxylesterase